MAGAHPVLMFPIGYGRRLVTLDELRAVHEPDMHPVFARSLWPWLIAQGGMVGIGGGVRDEQPTGPTFAPPGRSFHERQRFASGIVAYCAVDLVARNGTDRHRAPTWAEVPAQGSPEAGWLGVHANVQRPPEPWHLQPWNIDGYDRWVDDGRPDPLPGSRFAPPIVPPRPPEVPTMTELAYIVTAPAKYRGAGAFLVDGPNVRYATSRDMTELPASKVPRVELPVDEHGEHRQYELLFESVIGRPPWGIAQR